MKLGGIPVSKLCYTAAFTSALVIIFLAVYILGNHSGHSGASPWVATSVFLPTAVLGGYSLIMKRKKCQSSLPGLAALSAGFLGMAFLIWLDTSNTLLSYEVWLQRGMP